MLRLLRPRCRFSMFAPGLLLALPVAAAAPEWLYGVKPGDTLISVASSYLTHPQDWRKLQTLNGVTDPRRLVPGSTLRLPVALLKREAAVAEVIHVRGQVSRTATDGRTQSVAAGDRLETGDTIETAADASVSLRFVDGSRLLLTQNTRVSLAEMLLFGKTGMARTLLDLHRGSVDARVAAQQKPSARYEIRSRALNLAVRGTDFRAHVAAADQSSRSEVLDGMVQASGAGGSGVALPAGFGTLALPGETPRPAQPLPPPPALDELPALLQQLPLRFEWRGVAGAERYRARIFADRSFERLLRDDVFEQPVAKWADLPDGSHVLRVSAIDPSGLQGPDAEHAFVLKARPEPPFVITPLAGQKVHGQTATLRWSASGAGEPSYRVQVSTRPDFSELHVDLPALAQTELALPLAPGQYYWRIASVAAERDQGPYSDAQGFVQRKIPDSPASEPAQLDDKRLVFHWRAGEAGETYQVQVARAADFLQPVQDSVVATNQSAIERPAPGIYYMRVRAIDADGFAGPFGPVQQVEVPSRTPWWLLLFLAPFAL